MYIFDPSQFKEFGYCFFEGNDFYYRYQLSKKLFWKNIYIPFGPNCRTEKSFENFLEYIHSWKFTNITIDLPMIYNNRVAKDVVQKLTQAGFKNIPYVYQDEETIILLKSEFKLNGKRMNEAHHGYAFADIVVKKEVGDKEIDRIYEIYLASSQRIGFVPKKKGVFTKLSENCLVALAYNKENQNIEGYVFGYIMEGNILSIMFTGLTDYGRDRRLGHTLYYDVFNSAFEQYGIDMIDLRGASRTKNRSYVTFKQHWGGAFYPLPGSFTKTFLFS